MVATGNDKQIQKRHKKKLQAISGNQTKSAVILMQQGKGKVERWALNSEYSHTHYLLPDLSKAKWIS